MCRLLKLRTRWGSTASSRPRKWPEARRILPRATWKFRLSATDASPEEFVDGHVAGEKRQAVGQLEDPLVQGAAVPHPGAAQRRLVNQLQRQAWSHAFRLCPVQPHTKSQAPKRSNSGTSSQMPAKFPMTLSARNCRTPYSMLRGSHGMGLVRFSVGPDLDGRLRIRAVTIEFFFEGRTSR